MKKRVGFSILVILSLLSIALLTGCTADVAEEAPSEEEVSEPVEVEQEAEAEAEAEVETEEEAEEVSEKIQVVLLLSGSPADQTWDFDAYQAFNAVTDRLDFVEVVGIDENVSDTDAESFMLDYGSQGVDLIIGNTFGYWESAQKATEVYPDMAVVFPGGDESLTTPSVGTYYPNTYEATYLIGMMAGYMTESDHIGWILSVALPPLRAEANAYILGAQSVNPDVKVSVIETGDFVVDATRESEAAQTLIDQGIDFLGFELNGLAALDTAAGAGILVVPPFVDQSKLAPEYVPTCSKWNWEPYYEWLMTEVYQGTWESSVEYWGIEKGMADICEIGSMIPTDVQEQIMAKRQEIIDGDFEVPFLGDENLWDTE